MKHQDHITHFPGLASNRRKKTVKSAAVVSSPTPPCLRRHCDPGAGDRQTPPDPFALSEPLRTEAGNFSISIFLADLAALIVRHEGISPGAALRKRDELLQEPWGNSAILQMIEDELRTTSALDEMRRITALRNDFTTLYPVTQDRRRRNKASTDS